MLKGLCRSDHACGQRPYTQPRPHMCTNGSHVHRSAHTGHRRTAAGCNSLGCHVCRDSHLPYRRQRKCMGPPSHTSDSPLRIGRARARPEASNSPLGMATPLPKQRVVTPRPNLIPPGYGQQFTTRPPILHAWRAGSVVPTAPMAGERSRTSATGGVRPYR